MKTPLTPIKIIATASLNLGLFYSAIRSNIKYENRIANLNQQERLKLEARDSALSSNRFYLSDNPYLRAMAIARYESDQAVKLGNSNISLKLK
jgi:hypothetical protein